MKTKSNSMIFTRSELQYIANALTFSTRIHERDLNDFKCILDLLDRFNAELDEFTLQDMQNEKEE